MLKIYEKKSGAEEVLCLQGKIVYGETEILCDTVASVCEMSAIILDLTQVTTVDAHGLGVLLELRELALCRGIRFQLRNVGRQILNVLHMTRLDSVFEIASSVEFFPPLLHGHRPRAATLRTCA